MGQGSCGALLCSDVRCGHVKCACVASSRKGTHADDSCGLCSCLTKWRWKEISFRKRNQKHDWKIPRSWWWQMVHIQPMQQRQAFKVHLVAIPAPWESPPMDSVHLCTQSVKCKSSQHDSFFVRKSPFTCTGTNTAWTWHVGNIINAARKKIMRSFVWDKIKNIFKTKRFIQLWRTIHSLSFRNTHHCCKNIMANRLLPLLWCNHCWCSTWHVHSWSVVNNWQQTTRQLKSLEGKVGLINQPRVLAVTQISEKTTWSGEKRFVARLMRVAVSGSCQWEHCYCWTVQSANDMALLFTSWTSLIDEQCQARKVSLTGDWASEWACVFGDMPCPLWG